MINGDLFRLEDSAGEAPTDAIRTTARSCRWPGKFVTSNGDWRGMGDGVT